MASEGEEWALAALRAAAASAAAQGGAAEAGEDEREDDGEAERVVVRLNARATGKQRTRRGDNKRDAMHLRPACSCAY